MKRLLIVLMVAAVSCSTGTPRTGDGPLTGEMSARVAASAPASVGRPRAAGAGEEPVSALPPSPLFRPVAEDISPLKRRLVSVSVRRAPFRDVVKVIADTAHLNMVMQKGVDPEMPVTITLNNVSIKDALDIICSSVDYFYEVRGNLLIIKAQDTMLYEFGHPAMITNYSLSLGGDILGGVSASGAATSSSSGNGETELSGDITLEASTQEEGQDLWRAIESSIEGILAADRSRPKPYFSINRITGTIAVTASRHSLEKIRQLLNRIRESLNRQVMIEARIVEVQLNEGLKYGIDWNFLDDWKGVGAVSIGTFDSTGGQQRPGLSSVVDPTKPFFSFGVTGVNFASLLKALQTQGDVRVLSNPRISLMNGQTAMLSVGRNVNFISRVQTTTTTAGTTGTVTFTIDTSSILSGLIIGMVPFISSDGVVSMTITPIITDLIRLEDKDLGTFGGNTLKISLPTVDLREMSTTVRVKDNEMIVIGGLINRKEIERDSGVPVLSKIPLLGYFFRSTESLKERTELVIMLRPIVKRD